MFRGKESSNRIELSRLVQDLLNFGVLGSLRLWGWGVGGGGWLGGRGWGMVGGCPHTCAHTHACVVNMIISCKWLPPLGESLGIPYDVIHTCVCECMCTWMGCTLSPPPTPQRGGTPRIIQNSIALELIKIFQLFEDLKSMETPPPTGGYIIWWVDGWDQVKSLKI